MKKYLLSFSFAVLVAAASVAQRTPQASPGASIVQAVGITDVALIIDKFLLSFIVAKDTVASRTYPQFSAFVKRSGGFVFADESDCARRLEFNGRAVC